VTRSLPATPRTEQLIGVGLVMLAAVGFGSGPFFANVAYDAGMSALPIVFWRFVAATIVAWGFVLASGGGRASLRTLSRPRVLTLLVLGVLYVGNSGTYVAALETVPVALVSMIVFIYPALVAVLSLWFGRRLEGRRAWVALGISTAGVLLAVGGVPEGAMPPLTGLALAIASPIIYAFWIVLSARVAGERRRSRRTARATIPPSDVEAPTGSDAAPPAAAAASTLMITATAAGFGVLLLATGRSVVPASVPEPAWPALIAFGAFSAIAIQAFYGGVRRIGGARASLLSTVEPIYTIAIATLLFGEYLAPVQLVGGALVIGGVLLAETGSGRGRARPVAPAIVSEGPTGPGSDAAVGDLVGGG
jgi:drug/metabolite transporter (DMT)-like permease